MDDPLSIAIRSHLAARAAGATLEELCAEFPNAARRTLQRRLAALAAEGQIRASGASRARRFATRNAANRGTEVDRLTAPALEVQALIRRPLMDRAPAGYRRSFLDDYQPNITMWLPPATRKQLHELGRSPAEGRPAGTFARQILDRLLIDLAWASSRLEGNTYTRLDTQNLIAFGRLAEGKDKKEAQMILNHKAAIELLVGESDSIGFNRYTLQNLHAVLSEGLLGNPDASGRLRTLPVGVSGTVYQPTAIPQVIDECFARLLATVSAIDDPFEQSFFVMAQLPYLQPFEDVNKRTSRLAANIPLILENLVPLSFVDVPERTYVEGLLGIYELNRVALLRDVYVWAYERSCARYQAITDGLPAPDPLRERWRAEIYAVVAGLVQAGDPVDEASVRAAVRAEVGERDTPGVLAIVLNELHTLHEGNIARFRIRPSEFRAWIAAVTDDRRTLRARTQPLE